MGNGRIQDSGFRIQGAVAARCDDPYHCITCSDEALPLRVVAVVDDGVVRCADEAGGEREVLTALVGAVAVGERLLVHAGAALARLEEEGEER
jgi:hydrogenase maturation factor